MNNTLGIVNRLLRVGFWLSTLASVAIVIIYFASFMSGHVRVDRLASIIVPIGIGIYIGFLMRKEATLLNQLGAVLVSLYSMYCVALAMNKFPDFDPSLVIVSYCVSLVALSAAYLAIRYIVTGAR